LARAWTSGLAKGWPPIEAVVAKLKQSCALDPDAQVPADCDDSVAYFLLHSRRGPDYQFASAAAVLLRGLGYSTRLVSGFYASPLRYDKRSRHTPVTKGDVHFWLQVSLKDGTWIEIEPTPGYELAGPAPTWGGRAAALMAIVWAFACSHATMLGAFAMASLATFGRRNALIGGLATISWRLDFVGSPERRVMATLRLLERRGRLAGAPRPASQTPVQWYGRLGGMLPVSARAHLADMLAVADWHLHAPRRQWGEIPWSNEEISASCRQIAGAWTLAWLLRSQGRRRRGVIERLTAPLSSRYSRPSAKNGALVLTNGFN
jgi:hypothetical protein